MLRHLPLKPISPGALEPRAAQICALAEHYRTHRFDLLGSGWVQVRHGIQCGGLEGHVYQSGRERHADCAGEWLRGLLNDANLAESKRIWKLVDSGYVPIDWQLDFKSGYRWSERTWHHDIAFAHQPGVDVKVPWELARMQHLPQLAFAYALAARGEAGFEPGSVYAREFRNQVLDFIAANPPRFGVNWRSSMDAAIRVANWLVAYDLFHAYGVSFDEEFQRCLARSVYEHGLHIARTMRWDRAHPTNHYLADVVGMLFVAAHLEPPSSVARRWLTWALHELTIEVGRQFLDDGANFEASTSYHRLSAEMVVYATALGLGLADEGTREEHFPAWYMARLEKMAEFTIHATKPNGRIAQIGDNDSGRFLKLDPVYPSRAGQEASTRHADLACDHGSGDPAHWHENHLDHRHLVGAIGGLFQRRDFLEFAGGTTIDREVIQSFARGYVGNSDAGEGGGVAAARVRIGTRGGFEEIAARLDRELERHKRRPFEIPAPGIRRGLKLYGYPRFGLYLFRSETVFIGMRCGTPAHDGAGGHAHNDQLAMEINLSGLDWISDPGSYLYTPLPGRRNEYRSVKAHFAPQLEGREPARLDLGMFRLGGPAAGECLYFGPEGFFGRHSGYGVPVYRIVRLLEDRIQSADWIERGNEMELLGSELRPEGFTNPVLFSPGYGIRLAIE